MSLESKDATCVGSLCERANSHGTRDFAGDTDLQAPFRNVIESLTAQWEVSGSIPLGLDQYQGLKISLEGKLIPFHCNQPDLCVAQATV